MNYSENTPSVFGGAPIVQLGATSGFGVRLQGGSTSAGIKWRCLATPTAAFTCVSMDNTGGSTQGMSFKDSSVSVSVSSVPFTVDGLTLTKGSGYVNGGGVSMTGTGSAGRAIVQADTTPGAGLSTYNTRVSGATGCVKLVENQAAGTLNAYSGTRLDPKCTYDLAQTGTGPVNTFGAQYGPTLGTITPVGSHLAGATSLPSLPCSPQQPFMVTAAGSEQLCLCNAAGSAWLCKAFP